MPGTVKHKSFTQKSLLRSHISRKCQQPWIRSFHKQMPMNSFLNSHCDRAFAVLCMTFQYRPFFEKKNDFQWNSETNAIQCGMWYCITRHVLLHSVTSKHKNWDSEYLSNSSPPLLTFLMGKIPRNSRY